MTLSFRGVTQKIQGYVTRNGTTFGIYQAGQCVDMLGGIDIVKCRSRDGTYFCELCLEPVRYNSRQALWEQHCFEPMLEWANASFQPGQWLHIAVHHGGSSWAEIKSHNTYRQDSERFEFLGAWPVLLHPHKALP